MPFDMKRPPPHKQTFTYSLHLSCKIPDTVPLKRGEPRFSATCTIVSPSALTSRNAVSTMKSPLKHWSKYRFW